MQAHRTRDGGVVMGRAPPREKPLLLPCAKCIGCVTATAKAWALRAHLELQQHAVAAFSTLTYDEKHRPPTLSRAELSGWLKRLRYEVGPNRPIRFLASGEYGEENGRPHYHAILYGCSEKDRELIDKSWKRGLTYTVNVSAAAINYVAGYTAKKLVTNSELRRERVDEETGELYTYQPPFLQMSRRPGIGGEARRHTQSWRSYAIHNGQRMPVPRFLHEAWKKTATEEEIAELAQEKEEQQKIRQTTLKMLEAQEHINKAKQRMKAAKRRL